MILCYKIFQQTKHPAFTLPFLENLNVRPWDLRGVNHLMWFSSLQENKKDHLGKVADEKIGHVYLREKMKRE